MKKKPNPFAKPDKGAPADKKGKKAPPFTKKPKKK